MDIGIGPAGLKTRLQTTEELEEHGWDRKKASEWANRTADSAAEILKWERAGFDSEQAHMLYVLVEDVEPADWRDLGLPADVTVQYAEAGFSYDEVCTMEASNTRPDAATFDTLRALRLDKIEQAVKDFKAALRADSEFADLADDWS